ncbi:hypothetical protein F5887DRAFT_996869 [Amanita rubescens]|nr:hypothetical protein F5887DRAFT_996869 [Amanita rubescens]
MARELSSEGKLTAEDIASDYTNAGTSRVCSAIGTPAEDTLVRKKSIYNLPNSPIGVQARHFRRSASESSSVSDPMDDTRDACISEDNGTHMLLVDSSATEECTPGDDFAFADEDLLWFLRPEHFSSLDITASITRVICFIPWCICVGGTMLLWPDKLEQVAFEAGYMDSTQGIRRFAHWADVGHQFVMIFLAFLATALWALPVTVGATLFVGLATRFGYVWRGFPVDHSMPLGNDDRQSLYLLATVGRDLMEKSVLAKTEAGFVIIA